jgi:hypothetical protein
MRAVCSIVAIVAYLSACATSPADDPGNTDASHEPHEAGGNDAGTPVEASVDATTGTDSGPSPDATPEAAAPITGMTWPVGQVFPSFAPIANLDVVLSPGRPADMITLVVTLQGIVNKTRPRIYVSEDTNAAKLWLNEMKAVTATVVDPLTLVTKYKAEVAGIVIYDDAVIDTLNLATTIAGVKGGIVASPGIAATLTAAPYQLPVLADLRTNHFASKLDVYQYELDNYAPLASHRLIIGLTPDIRGNLRDYAIATGALTVWLDPTKADETAMLGRFLSVTVRRRPHRSPRGSDAQIAA